MYLRLLILLVLVINVYSDCNYYTCMNFCKHRNIPPYNCYTGFCSNNKCECIADYKPCSSSDLGAGDKLG